jgi:hypothetical protein
VKGDLVAVGTIVGLGIQSGRWDRALPLPTPINMPTRINIKKELKMHRRNIIVLHASNLLLHRVK